MRIETLPLQTNGTVSSQTPIKAWRNDNVGTLAAAVAYSGPPTIRNGLLALRKRQFMQKGVVGHGLYKPTDYYSLSGRFLPNTGVRLVYQTGTNPPRYGSLYQEIGFGYTGGAGTGLGEPWRAYLRNDTYNTPTAIANRLLIANTINRVNTEILVKARNNKMSLGETLGELDDTVGMVARKSVQVLQAFYFARKGNWKKAAEALDLRHLTDRRGRNVQNASSAASRWLALNYGWMPLLHDIFDGINLVNNGFNQPDGTFVVTRRLKQSLIDAGWAFNVADYPYYGTSSKADVQLSVEQKYKLRIKDELMAYLISLGLDNPLNVAWNLLPYTFVLDWMLPVSDWLQALSAPLGLQFVSGYRSSRIVGSIRYTAKSYVAQVGQSNVVLRDGEADSRFIFNELTREALTSFPSLQLYFRFPFSNPSRMATAISLIQQRRA